MTRVVLTTAAFAAVVVVWTAAVLPQAPVALDPAWIDGTMAGLLHVHTNRSDGRSSPEEIAEIARQAGLKFLVFTDHGDATREPDPPAYRSGVLCLDAVEISTTGGHYIGLDLAAAPYPLAGESRDVVDDVRRLGGFGIAAHPDSPKTELAWSDWKAPIDGLELTNLDTSWRVHVAGGWRSRLALANALLSYPIRAEETIGSLLGRSDALEMQWGRLTASRQVVGLAGADAHARLALRGEEPGTAPVSLPFPGYGPSFRVISVHVVPSAAMTGDARADARAILGGIRQGHVYNAVDAWARPPAFDFTAKNERGTARFGDVLAAGGPIEFHVRSNAPAGYVTRLWRDGTVLTQEASARELTIPTDGAPGVYRITVAATGRPDGPPWLMANPIYVRAGTPSGARPIEQRPSLRPALPLFDGRSTAGWSQEMDPTSLAVIEAVPMVKGTELRMRYGLSGGAAAGQFAGVTVETPGGAADYRALAFSIRAERPMRLSVQARAEVPGAPPERWQRSVVVGPEDGEREVVFDDMRPVGVTHTPLAPRAGIRTVLFVVDTTNTRPGSSGRIWLKHVRLVP